MAGCVVAGFVVVGFVVVGCVVAAFVVAGFVVVGFIVAGLVVVGFTGLVVGFVCDSVPEEVFTVPRVSSSDGIIAVSSVAVSSVIAVALVGAFVSASLSLVIISPVNGSV